MFDKQAVENYRCVTAPGTLKDRVMTAAIRPKRSFTRLLPLAGTIAACLALVVVASVLTTVSPASVLVSTDGELHSATSTVMPVSSYSRIQADSYAVITLQADGEITVTSDAPFGIQSEDGTFVDLSFPHTASDHLTLYWYLTSSDAVITVNGTDYHLHADEKNGCVTVTKE